MNLADAIEVAQRSVVQVTSRNPASRERVGPIGTGFAVHPDGYIATAKHVIDAVPQGWPICVGVAAPNLPNMRANFSVFEVEVVGSDQEHDLAILKLPRPLHESRVVLISMPDSEIAAEIQAALLRVERPRDGDPVAVTGYPLGEAVTVTNHGALASVWSYEKAGWETRDRYLGDFTANHGNSGGPVYRVEDASVIGVCVAGRLTPLEGGQGAVSAGLTVIVPVGYLVDLLGRHGIAHTKA